MDQRRRVPVGNTVEFVDAIPRGLVDVKNIRDFMERSPKDFPEALKKANEEAARTGRRFLAIRVSLSKNLLRAPQSIKFTAAQRISYEAFNLGRVDRIAGDPGHVKESIYIMLPDTINGVRVMDRRGLPPCPRGFLEATPNGFKGTANSRQFLEEAPPGFLEAYKEAEKKSPGQIYAIRMPVGNNLTESESIEASLEATWKALQINPPAGLRASRKEDLAAASKVFTHPESDDAKERAARGEKVAGMIDQLGKDQIQKVVRLVVSEAMVVAEKVNKKKNKKKKGKKAPGQESIEDMIDQLEKDQLDKIASLIESEAMAVAEKVNKKGKGASGQGGIEDMNDLKATVDSIDTERETVC